MSYGTYHAGIPRQTLVDGGFSFFQPRWKISIRRLTGDTGGIHSVELGMASSPTVYVKRGPGRESAGEIGRGGNQAEPQAVRVCLMAHFPTQIDVDFYLSKQKLPAWAQKVQKIQEAKFDAAEGIEFIVNAHAGVRGSDGERAAHNLLAIVRGYRRRKVDLGAELCQLSTNPGCVINPEKRAAFARKWARRLGAI